MTFTNVTALDIALSYTANGVQKNHTLRPGQQFTFDCHAENGESIRQQLLAAGAEQTFN